MDMTNTGVKFNLKRNNRRKVFIQSRGGTRHNDDTILSNQIDMFKSTRSFDSYKSEYILTPEEIAEIEA